MKYIKKLTKDVKKHPIRFIFGIISLGFIAQIIVDLLFLIGSVYPVIKTNYSANVILSYWGGYVSSLIGAMVAIIGVFITIQYNQKQTKKLIKSGNKTTKKMIISSKKDADEANRKSIMPIIAINRVISKNKHLIFSDSVDKTQSDDKEDGYKEYDVEEFYFSIDPKAIHFSHELDSEKKRKIENGFKIVEVGNTTIFLERDYQFMPFRLCNVGLGPALNMTLSVIKDDLVESQEFHITSIAFSMKNNLDMRLGFYLTYPSKCQGEYKFKIAYYDINGLNYRQEHKLIVSENNSTLDLSIKQEFGDFS